MKLYSVLLDDTTAEQRRARCGVALKYRWIAAHSEEQATAMFGVNAHEVNEDYIEVMLVAAQAIDHILDENGQEIDPWQG